jgi:hypothetical protein
METPDQRTLAAWKGGGKLTHFRLFCYIPAMIKIL